MSCYIVSKRNIDALVFGARMWYREPLRDHETGNSAHPMTNPSLLGCVLWQANSDAFGDRYGQVPDRLRDLYRFNDQPDAVNAILINLAEHDYSIGEVYGALRCYVYQTCDKRDWDGSEVQEWCIGFERALLDECMRRLGEDVPWGIDD